MKYERLTERETFGMPFCAHQIDNDCLGIIHSARLDCNECPEIMNRLAELEDKIEAGTLVELPCKVGDTVYEVFIYHTPPFIQETTIDKIIITNKGLKLKLARNSVYETAISSLGKTVFLTKAEAEKRLKELRGEK